MRLISGRRLLENFKTILSPARAPTLMKIQNMYASELIPNRFTYTLQEKGHKPVNIKLEFDEGNFCHLFSIASVVKNVTPDLEAFSGYKGWKNIQEGRITFKTLRQMDPQQFAYYRQEYNYMEELLKMIRNPQIVQYDSSKVSNSSLECDYILYAVKGAQVLHLGISQGENGLYFPRSYFIREVSQDRHYPTKYIANMKQYKVRTKTAPKPQKDSRKPKGH